MVRQRIVTPLCVGPIPTTYPNKKVQKENNIMELKIMLLENRIALLTNRDPVGNMRIINKAKRRLRAMKNSYAPVV